MNIQDFLLARVAQDESENVAGDGPEVFRRRRDVVFRHHDRSMTVMSIGRFETVTRCSICSGESARPCEALRKLARPHRHHPDYDAEWDLTPAG